MSDDLKLVEQLETEIGIKLPRIALEQIGRQDITGFAADDKDRVKGLSIWNHKLKVIPTQILKLKHLEKLALVDTHISDISSLHQLTKIKCLDLRNNAITSIHGKFIEMGLAVKWHRDGEAAGLYLEGNPLNSPLMEIVKEGPEAVKANFHAIETIKQKMQNSNTVKVTGDRAEDIALAIQQILHLTNSDQSKSVTEWFSEIESKLNSKLTIKRDDLLDTISDFEKAMPAESTEIKRILQDIKDNLEKKFLFAAPINKLKRLLTRIHDRNSDFNKTVLETKQRTITAQKLGQIYNELAELWGLPQLPDVLLKRPDIPADAVLSIKLDKIKMANFRGYTDKEFTFSKHFNLLLGDNGSGKTSILDALNILLSSIFIGFGKTSSIYEIKKADVKQVSNTYDNEVRMENRFPVTIEAKGDIMGKTVSWSKSRSDSSDRTYEEDWELTEITSQFQQPVKNGDHVTLPVIAYYGTGRLWLQKEEKEIEPLTPSSRFHGYSDSLDPKSNEKELLRWMKQQELSLLQKRTNGKLYQAAKKAITDCIEDYEEVWFDFSVDSLMVKLKNGDCLPANLLSDGYRNMVAMVADIAYRMAMLNPHLGVEVTHLTPGVVLIDEIDLHLHPKWQRSAVADLKRAFPQVQFVATSHSPFIVQSLAGPEELIDLNQGEKIYENLDISIEDIAEEIMRVKMPQKSERYKEMMKVAEQYYKKLDEGKSVDDDEELRKIKHLLDELLIPYSDNPAFQAFLKMERTAAGLHETGK
ncbi:MAG: AAA family ATPase [bacterium]|nr:AAA family ATPase [bacterium]